MTSVVACLMTFSPYSHADQVEIPFPIYMEEFKFACKQHGLDLDGTENSKGFVEDKGGHFVVYTYRSVSLEDLDLIKALTWEHIRN